MRKKKKLALLLITAALILALAVIALVFVFEGSQRADRISSYMLSLEHERPEIQQHFQDDSHGVFLPWPITLIIDPGHGGIDPGATISDFVIDDQRISMKESDITLSVAKMIKQRLENVYQDLTILLTREEDRYMSLEERVILGNSLFSDEGEKAFFISLHVEHSFDSNNSGMEILLSREITHDSPAFLLAESIVSGFNDIFGEALPFRGIQTENIYYPSRVNMPSLIVNLAFLSNVNDRALFYYNLESFAAAIVNGVKEYCKQ